MRWLLTGGVGADGPVSTVSLLDSSTNTTLVLPARLHEARAWHAHQERDRLGRHRAGGDIATRHDQVRPVALDFAEYSLEGGQVAMNVGQSRDAQGYCFLSCIRLACASAEAWSGYGPSSLTPSARPPSSSSALTTYQRLPRCRTPCCNPAVQLFGVMPTRSPIPACQSTGVRLPAKAAINARPPNPTARTMPRISNGALNPYLIELNRTTPPPTHSPRPTPHSHGRVIHRKRPAPANRHKKCQKSDSGGTH